jgi:hypothetical protein
MANAPQRATYKSTLNARRSIPAPHLSACQPSAVPQPQRASCNTQYQTNNTQSSVPAPRRLSAVPHRATCNAQHVATRNGSHHTSDPHHVALPTTWHYPPSGTPTTWHYPPRGIHRHAQQCSVTQEFSNEGRGTCERNGCARTAPEFEIVTPFNVTAPPTMRITPPPMACTQPTQPRPLQSAAHPVRRHPPP